MCQDFHEIVDFLTLNMCSKRIFCSKTTQKGKTARKLEPQKVTPNAKSCSKVAKHKRDRPIDQGIQTVSGAHNVMGSGQSLFSCKLLMQDHGLLEIPVELN